MLIILFVCIIHYAWKNLDSWEWSVRWCCCGSATIDLTPQIARFTWPTWGPPGSCRPQVAPMLAPWTLLSGPFISEWHHNSYHCSNGNEATLTNIDKCVNPIHFVAVHISKNTIILYSCSTYICELTQLHVRHVSIIHDLGNWGCHNTQNSPNLISTSTWWRHQMETFSALWAICAGNSPVPGEFPAQMPVTRSFDIFFDLRLNKRLSKQSWGWWFETLSHPLWRHSNVLAKFRLTINHFSVSQWFEILEQTTAVILRCSVQRFGMVGRWYWISWTNDFARF